MIVFSCVGCGQRLTARPEWAGKSCRCPHCGAASPVVPAAIPAVVAASTVPLLSPRSMLAATPSPGALADTSPAGPTPRSDDRPTVPGYEILGELGRGGMGVVYQARQVKLKRLVALKMILSGAHAGTEELGRFRAEAEAVARLQHPNIVQIYEVGEYAGRPFFSLEYIAGGTLGQQLAGKPQPARDAAQLLEVVARAIHYAHQRGIVHRDLKPANLLLASGGREPPGELTGGSRPPLADFSPKIVDFGLAKQLDTDSAQTHSGAILGTPSYVAPEQAAGKTHAIGPATDVYALGAILYEMLTGGPPFRGEAVLDTLLMVLSEEPVPPTRLRPKVPRDLETICLKCLQKEPGRRYPTAEALADDLRRFLAGEPVQARPAGPAERTWRWCRRNPVPAGLLAAVFLLLLTLSSGSAFGLWQMSRLSTELVRSTALESAAQQSEMLEGVNNFYSSEVVNRVKPEGIEVTHDYAAKKGAIPLPATLTIDLGNHISRKSQRGMFVRLYSDYPFRSRKDGGPRDDFEREALRRLRQQPHEPFSRFEDVQGRPSLRYATARLMTNSCLKCHNTHPESTKTDWKAGDVRGVVEIIRPLDRDVARTHDGLRSTFRRIAVLSATLLLLGLTGLVLVVGGAVIVTRRRSSSDRLTPSPD